MSPDDARYSRYANFRTKSSQGIERWGGAPSHVLVRLLVLPGRHHMTYRLVDTAIIYTQLEATPNAIVRVELVTVWLLVEELRTTYLCREQPLEDITSALPTTGFGTDATSNRKTAGRSVLRSEADHIIPAVRGMRSLQSNKSRSPTA